MSLRRLKELAEVLPSFIEMEDDNETLKAILEGATDGYWDWNIQANTEFMSDAFKAQLGYKPYELDNVPQSWINLINKEDFTVMQEKLQEHFRTKGDVDFKAIGRYNHKQGHEVKILCRGQVIEWDKDNSPIRMVGTHTDITGL